MAIGSNSYGDTGEIAALVPRYANVSKVFDATTRPTLATIESLVDQVSGILNSALSTQGFDVPVTQADVRSALDMFVNDEVAAIAEGINGSGRFGPTAKKGSGSRHQIVMGDIQAFVTGNASGFERLGATRNYSVTAGLGFRDTDNSSNETFPIFQREAFGNRFTDWDSDD